jgi:hypothetical protein
MPLQAKALAGFHRLIARSGAVQRDDVADVARHRRLHAVAEARRKRAVRRQTPVRQHPHRVAIDSDGRRFLDDQRAGQAAAELLNAAGV